MRCCAGGNCIKRERQRDRRTDRQTDGRRRADRLIQDGDDMTQIARNLRDSCGDETWCREFPREDRKKIYMSVCRRPRRDGQTSYRITAGTYIHVVLFDVRNKQEALQMLRYATCEPLDGNLTRSGTFSDSFECFSCITVRDYAAIQDNCSFWQNACQRNFKEGLAVASRARDVVV